MTLKSLFVRRPHTPLTRLTLAAMVVTTLAYASEFRWLGLDLEVGIVVGCLVVGCLAVTSILVATGWRWTPALGVLIAGGVLLGNPFLGFNLSQPATSGFFWAAWTQLIASLVVVGTGIGSIVQSFRPGRKRALWGAM